jgi:Flp pilus assembly protein TadG
MRRNGVSRSFRLFGKKRDGATAVEFAMIAGPFFWLLMGIAESACLFLVQSSLDAAVMDASRKIRTGELQLSGKTSTQIESEVKATLCQRVQAYMPLDCTRLYLDVDAFTNFTSVNNPNPIVADDINTGQLGFDAGDPSEIVLVRSFYKWKINTPFFSELMGNINGKESRLMVSSMMFRNEPF